MKRYHPTRLVIGFSCAFLVASAIQAAAPPSPQGFITAKAFTGINGTAVTDLTGNAKFPNSPDVVRYEPYFEWNATGTIATAAPNWSDNYGVQILGYFYPPSSGNYTFFLSADDGAQLFLSTDTDPANKKLIAQESGWSNARSYTTVGGGSTVAEKNSSTFTGSQWPGGGAAITLTGGQPYYIEALMKEGGGGDNLSVSLDGTTPIPGANLSSIDRASATSTYLLVFNGNLAGVFWDVVEPGDTVTRATVQLTLDGAPVAASYQSLPNNVLRIHHMPAAPLSSGSAHTATLVYTDSGANVVDLSRNFTVATYATVPASMALSAPATVPGMTVNKVFQTVAARSPNENSIPTVEMAIAGGLVNADGTPQANIAEFPGPFPIAGASSSDVTWSPYLNWEQAGGEIDATAAPGAQPDNFNTDEPAGSAGAGDFAYVNYYIPGVDLGGVNPPDPNNFVIETVGYVRLSQGVHRWGFNSDDGFKISIALGPYGLLLGQFDGGRGAADTIFDFYVETAGDYPVRVLYWEGNGGANAEWFSQNFVTNEKILISDTAYYPTDAYQIFRTGQGRAYISKLVPSNGYQGAQAQPTLEVEITDGITQASNAQLWFDGMQVATGTKTGNITRMTFTPADEYALGSDHTGQIIYTESGQADPVTNNFAFSVREFTLGDLPADSRWIEIEDFDYEGGQTVPAASVWPYTTPAYNGLQATLNVDYFDDSNWQPADGAGVDLTYRGDRRPNHVNLTQHTTANTLALDRPGGITMTTNYRLGWAGNTWMNYTRTIPAGVYRGVAALSHGDGTGIIMQADLDEVTAGVGTETQELRRIGTFTGAGSTGWGNSILVPLKTPLGADAVFKLPGGPVTLRVTARVGDADWFALIPTTEAIPPIVTSIQPNLAHTVFRDNLNIQIQIEEFTTQLDEDSIEMMFDGQAVTPTFVRNGDIVTLTYAHSGLLDIGREHPFSLSFADDAEPPNTDSVTGAVVAHYLPGSPAGMFLIEAEDFNTDGGSVIGAVNTMPYLGNAYTNLSAVAGTDYIRVGAEPLDGTQLAGNVYRIGESPNVPMGANAGAVTDPVQVFDLARAMDASGNITWQMDVNFSLGWAGAGHWFNYTRNIPAATYKVFAAMSYQGTAVNQVDGSLARVVGPANVPDSEQVKEPIGRFHAEGTGDWGNNRLVPLRDLTTDEIITVDLAGETTLRWNWVSGDFDYMMLVPTGEIQPPGPSIDSITLADGNITITWSGDGVLEKTDALPATGGATWSPVAGTSPLTLPASAAAEYFRLRDDTP